MSELDQMRKQTKQYINFNPKTVTLTRPDKASDGAGGTLPAATPLPPQVVRIIQQREGSGTERRNSDGEVVRPSLVLLAEWNADVKEDDFFDWNGMRAEVVYVQKLETGGGTYELSCEVALT